MQNISKIIFNDKFKVAAKNLFIIHCTVPSNERQPKMFLPFSHLIEEKIASFFSVSFW